MDAAARYQEFRAIRFFGSLDGLRALSIMGVVWFHCWWGTPYYTRLQAMPVLRQGEYGVHIFFLISGFLITTLLLLERERFGRISLRDFYIRRALRIWPLYYATVALYIVVVLIFERGTGRAASFFHYLPAFLTYTYPWFISGYGWLQTVLPRDSLPARVILSVAIPICLGALLAQALHSSTGFCERHCNPVTNLLRSDQNRSTFLLYTEMRLPAQSKLYNVLGGALSRDCPRGIS